MAEVAVVGVPDDMMGEKVGAVIVPRGGWAPSRAELVAFAADRLADLQAAEYVLIQHEALPRGPGGKVSQTQLRCSLWPAG